MCIFILSSSISEHGYRSLESVLFSSIFFSSINLWQQVIELDSSNYVVLCCWTKPWIYKRGYSDNYAYIILSSSRQCISICVVVYYMLTWFNFDNFVKKWTVMRIDVKEFLRLKIILSLFLFSLSFCFQYLKLCQIWNNTIFCFNVGSESPVGFHCTWSLFTVDLSSAVLWNLALLHSHES